MIKSRRRAVLHLAIAAVITMAILSAGCISTVTPIPHEVMVRENIISVDPEYVSPSLILSLLLNPNSYEPSMFEAVDEYLPRTSPVVEAGAGIGALSAYINDRLEAKKSDHIAVEANPYLLPGLMVTKQTNRLGTIFMPAAVAYTGDTVEITVSTNILENQVSSARSTETAAVSATTIDRLILNSSFEDKGNVTLVLDIGGAEHTVIENEINLKEYVAVIIAAVYSDDKNTPESFSRKLTNLGFRQIGNAATDPNGFTTMVFKRA